MSATGIEFLYGEGTSMQIGPVSVPGIYEAGDTGGQSAPEHRVEQGFDFTTRIGPEPVEATFQAYCTGDNLSALQQLREEEDPFPTSVGATAIGECVLENLDWTEHGDYPNAYDVTIQIREVQLASTGTATLRVISDTGTKSESAGKGGDSPSLTQSSSESTSGGPDTAGAEGTSDNPFAGVSSSVKGWLGYE